MNKIIPIKRYFRFFEFVLALVILAAFFNLLYAQSETAKSRKQIIKESRALLKSAIKRLEAGEYSESMTYLDSVILLDKNNPDAYYYKGQAFLSLNDTSQALEFLSEGVKMAPRSSRLKLLLANIQLKHMNYDVVLSLTNEVLAFKPNEGMALYLKGSALMDTGDTTGALVEFDKAIEHYLKREN